MADIHEHVYSEEDKVRIAEEVERLRNIWNQYLDGLESGKIPAPLYQPPAAAELYSSILASANPLCPIAEIAPESDVVVQAIKKSLAGILAFGDVMFRFGQYCALRGILYNSLTQCRCLTIDESTLEKQIAQWAEEMRK